MLKINDFFTPVSRFELTIRLGFYFLIMAISVSFLIFVFFIHQKFYSTLAQTEQIVILKSQLALDFLDAETYSQIKNFLEKRNEAENINWEKLPNLFF